MNGRFKGLTPRAPPRPRGTRTAFDLEQLWPGLAVSYYNNIICASCCTQSAASESTRAQFALLQLVYCHCAKNRFLSLPKGQKIGWVTWKAAKSENITTFSFTLGNQTIFATHPSRVKKTGETSKFGDILNIIRSVNTNSNLICILEIISCECSQCH
jgi:hypothetical protein